MPVYNYDPELLNFTEETEAFESPLEPGVVLLPAYSTLTPPPSCASNQVACFVDGVWQCLTNNLGVVYWNAQGVAETMLTYGDLPQGSTTTPPPPTAEVNKQKASSLLYETDWTTIPDITDATKSNPYLGNQNDFIVYRNALRQIAVKPTAGEIVFPEKPVADWIFVA